MKKFLLLIFFFPAIISAQTWGGKALRFTTADHYLQVYDVSIDISADFTIECWVKFNSLTGEQVLIEKDDNPPQNHSYTLEVLLKKQSDNRIAAIMGSSTAWSWMAVASSATVSADTWYHIALVMSGTSLKLYLNGELAGTNTNSNPRRPDEDGPNMNLGSTSQQEKNLTGLLDEVRIWGIARSQAAIQSTMNEALIGTEAGLQAYFSMSPGAGLDLYDDQVNHLNYGELSINDLWVDSALPLPVELASFTAASVTSSQAVQLNWKTATEVNNYGFEIERKNIEWTKIGFVQGSGNSNSPKEYLFTDNTPLAGDIQYRLKQIDINGEYKYYDAVTVFVKSAKDYKLMQNSPNPFNPATAIKFQMPDNSFVTLKIYDQTGREVTTLINEERPAGSHIVYWNGKDSKGITVATGVYLYRLSAGSYTETKKMNFVK